MSNPDFESQDGDSRPASGVQLRTPRRQQLSRAAFLARSGTVLLGAAAMLTRGWGRSSPEDSRPGTPRRAQPAGPGGRRDSKVKRWDVVTIGNLSRNRYWGESDDKAVRPAMCTCTLIAGDSFRLLVDPSHAEAGEMARELDRRTGLKPRDITALFLSHDHADHLAGVPHFPEAKLLAAPAVASILNESGRLPRRVEAASGFLFDAVEMIPLPGHTLTQHGLRFDCDGLSVVVAGDAVATRDFFRERRSFFNAADFELSAKTMDRLADIADIIVPGHDNYFLSDGSAEKDKRLLFR